MSLSSNLRGFFAANPGVRFSVADVAARLGLEPNKGLYATFVMLERSGAVNSVFGTCPHAPGRRVRLYAEAGTAFAAPAAHALERARETFKTLTGVSPTAPYPDLKRAYIKARVLMHPGRFGDATKAEALRDAWATIALTDQGGEA